jgi:hypothetical protein
MPHITLTEEQARVVAGATEPIILRDTNGELLAVIPPPWSHAEIAEAQRRWNSDAPRHTTAQVIEHLRSLGAE